MRRTWVGDWRSPLRVSASSHSCKPRSVLSATRKPTALEPGAAVPEHRELRPAAEARLRGAAAGARRVAARPHELGGVDRVRRSGPGALRPARRLPPRRRRRRGHGVRATSGSWRRLAAGPCSGARPRRRVHVEPLPVARAGPRGVEVRHGAAGSARGVDRRAHGRRGLQRRPVVERATSPTCDAVAVRAPAGP